MQIVDYFYTAQQAAKVLGINRITIWRWMNSNKLHAQHIGSPKRGIVLIPKWEIELLKENVTKRNKSIGKELG
jgi:predicted site-specific integrase-resolvase